MNFKNFGNEPPSDGDGGSGGMQSPDIYSLARQTSIYSLTFDELQSTMGGTGKDLGSMNIDELLKSIWNAEDTQTVSIVGSSTTGIQGSNGVSGGGYLQSQGSLTLSRTLSQRTVDEVWRDLYKENGGGNESSVNMQQRQQTLGEITLEEFLVKAGIVREDPQLTENPNNGGIFPDFSRPSNNIGVGIGFQHSGQNLGIMQAHNLPLNFNGVNRSSKQQQPPHQLVPKQAGISYVTPISLPASAQLGSPKIRGGVVGYSDQGLNSSLAPGFQAGGTVMIANGSPASDGIGKSNGDTSSVSPVPYVFTGGVRGRKGGMVEKVVERRHRRMIKNRESAARSRARKQAYTTELETEVANLKEENEELRKKQAEIKELQKKQVLELLNMPKEGKNEGKKRCLRRTQTSPW